ncbi:Rha family transcriptional regulator [Salmonella enterica]|nr:Rha family transcriptional regulator [Salmonella enterica]
MNNLMNNIPTMTSQEIADLVGSRHDKVKQSIERLTERGVIQLPPMGDCGRINGLGLPQKSKHYLFEGDQGRRDSIVVVAQLSPEFTGRMVDRWQELEHKVEQLGTGSRPVQHSHGLDIASLAGEIAKAAASVAIATVLKTTQQHKAIKWYQIGGNPPRESVTFDCSPQLLPFEEDDFPRKDNSNSYLTVRALSLRTGLAESTCRRLVDFANIPAKKIRGLGLHIDSEAFISAVRCLIEESTPPKGRIKRWQHPEFGKFTLLGVLPESKQVTRC